MRTLLALLMTAVAVPAATFLVWSYNANEGISWLVTLALFVTGVGTIAVRRLNSPESDAAAVGMLWGLGVGALLVLGTAFLIWFAPSS